MRRTISLICLCFLMAGCAATATMNVMSRSDGKVYEGHMVKTAEGQGTMTIYIGDVIYSGKWARTSSDEYFSFTNGYAKDNRGNRNKSFNVTSGYGSAVAGMAILSSPAGDGLRCGLQGDRISGTGAGICVDAKENVYDFNYAVDRSQR